MSADRLDTQDSPPTRAATARRVYIPKAGSYERLKFEDVAVPAPRAEEVQIAVKGIGINYADVLIRMGLYSSAKEFVGWPITPGFEVSGIITAVGSSVSAFEVGDEVMAVTFFNGYTSQLVVDHKYVFKKPAGLSFAQAAGVPAVFMTAWYALHELAHPRPGHKVLIHSAAGGVGSSLVQLCKVAQCDVVGVVGRSAKVATARECGADHVIDKSTQNLWAKAKELAPDGYDLILDANGVATLKDSYKHLRQSGKLVVYGFTTMMPKKGGKPNWFKLIRDVLRTPRFNPLDMTNNSKSVLAFNLSYLFDKVDLLHAALGDIERWLSAGQIQAPPVTTYPFTEVARAHADIESGTTVGKLILVP